VKYEVKWHKDSISEWQTSRKLTRDAYKDDRERRTSDNLVEMQTSATSIKISMSAPKAKNRSIFRHTKDNI
jgi:hypothetical protein